MMLITRFFGEHRRATESRVLYADDGSIPTPTMTNYV